MLDISLGLNSEKFYEKAYSWILSVGPRLLFAVLVLVIGEWMIKLFRRWLQHTMQHKQIDPSLRPFLRSLIGTVLQVLLFLAVVQILGVQMTIFSALVGALGVAAGLALSGTLQNFTSGILILLLKPYEVGDAIAAQGQEGIVQSIQIFYTVVTTYDNKTLIIPNSKLSNEMIVNLSREGKRRMDIELRFNFGYSFESIKAVIEKSIASFEELPERPAYRIGVSALEPDGFKILINLWVQAHQYIDMKLVFQEKLMEDLKNNGIKLPGM